MVHVFVQPVKPVADASNVRLPLQLVLPETLITGEIAAVVSVTEACFAQPLASVTVPVSVVVDVIAAVVKL